MESESIPVTIEVMSNFQFLSVHNKFAFAYERNGLILSFHIDRIPIQFNQETPTMRSYGCCIEESGKASTCITCMTVSDDVLGQIIIGYADKSVHIVNTLELNTTLRLTRLNLTVVPTVLACSNNILACASIDGGFCVFDTSNERARRIHSHNTLRGYPGIVLLLRFLSPNSLLCVQKDGCITLWEILRDETMCKQTKNSSTRKKPKDKRDVLDLVKCVSTYRCRESITAVYLKGEDVYVAVRDGGIQVMNLSKWETEAILSIGSETGGRIVQLVVSANGALAARLQSGSIFVWRSMSSWIGSKLPCSGPDNTRSSRRFLANCVHIDNYKVIAGCSSGKVAIWDLNPIAAEPRCLNTRSTKSILDLVLLQNRNAQLLLISREKGVGISAIWFSETTDSQRNTDEINSTNGSRFWTRHPQ
eukprot:CAMPEP_0182451228 /NCGR_PEP_ID=MMETSP1172-20130603/43605_1 /TAXON_ID=708627 /ORGANISM="Timspurckia oligopyrenoides, Strain CCMP3278" /LENGTH=418 /DNA_ID=CAMNT_0024648979 /DNA_START=220 /DNA_END=1476 /DNA_ORIENTATION=+